MNNKLVRLGVASLGLAAALAFGPFVADRPAAAAQPVSYEQASAAQLQQEDAPSGRSSRAARFSSQGQIQDNPDCPKDSAPDATPQNTSGDDF